MSMGPPQSREPPTDWPPAESKPEWPRADYLKVRGTNQHNYLLKHDLEIRRLVSGENRFESRWK